MRGISILVFLFSISAVADPGLPKKAAILTDIAGPVQNVEFSNLDLSLIKCSQWHVDLGQPIVVRLNDQTYQNSNPEFSWITYKAASPPCSTDSAHVRFVQMSVTHSTFPAIHLRIELNLEDETVVLRSFGIREGVVGQGKITKRY